MPKRANKTRKKKSTKRPVRRRPAHGPLRPERTAAPSLELEQRLSVLLTHGRALILQTHRPDSCIFSSRLAVEFLREGGIDAHEMPVVLNVISPEMAKRVAAGPLPASREEGARWLEEGCYIVRVGDGVLHPGVDGWDGHLVCIIENRLLLDLSLDQANRPEFGIAVTPLVGHIPRDFASGNSEWDYTFEGGTVVTYRARLENVSYKYAPDWWEPMRSERALQRLRELLAECKEAVQ